jgi:hypothetical protein
VTGPAGPPTTAGRGPGRRRSAVAAGWSWATDPAGPAVVLAAAAVVAAAAVPVLTWAIVGGLAGYSLSGSV